MYLLHYIFPLSFLFSGYCESSSIANPLRNMQLPFQNLENCLILVKSNLATDAFLDFISNNQGGENGPRWIIFNKYDLQVNMKYTYTKYQQEIPIVTVFELPLAPERRPMVADLHEFYYTVFRDVTVTLYIRDIMLVGQRMPLQLDILTFSHPTTKIVMIIKQREILELAIVCRHYSPLPKKLKFSSTQLIKLSKSIALICTPNIYPIHLGASPDLPPEVKQKSCLYKSHVLMYILYKYRRIYSCRNDRIIMEYLEQLYNFTTKMYDARIAHYQGEYIYAHTQIYMQSYYASENTFLTGSGHERLLYCIRAGEKGYDFLMWVAPFKPTVWVSLSVTFILAVLVASKCESLTAVIGEGVWLMAILLRQLPSHRYFYVFLAFVSLVISIGYESKITSKLIVPPPPYVYPTLRAFLDAGYKIIFRTDLNFEVSIWGKYQIDFKKRGLLIRLTDSFYMTNDTEVHLKVLKKKGSSRQKLGMVSFAEFAEDTHNLLSFKEKHYDRECYLVSQTLTVSPLGIYWLFKTSNRYWLKRTMQRFMEAGLLTFWEKHSLFLKKRNCKLIDIKREKKPGVQMKGLATFFFIWIIVIFLALIFFCVEKKAYKSLKHCWRFRDCTRKREKVVPLTLEEIDEIIEDLRSDPCRNRNNSEIE
ncbi:unnamed protein product [Orchesella dallaii]|uniref:Uncharacterized protein n=1 Tax=Orchesella dallaii TaxID=48710 RepID=A0ABP1QUK0_9HEXA